MLTLGCTARVIVLLVHDHPKIDGATYVKSQRVCCRYKYLSCRSESEMKPLRLFTEGLIRLAISRLANVCIGVELKSTVHCDWPLYFVGM